jgi:hypothetical protein
MNAVFWAGTSMISGVLIMRAPFFTRSQEPSPPIQNSKRRASMAEKQPEL